MWIVAIIPVPGALISVVSTSHWISYPGPARTEPDQRTNEQLFVLGSSIQYISPKWQLRDLKPQEQSVDITTEKIDPRIPTIPDRRLVNIYTLGAGGSPGTPAPRGFIYMKLAWGWGGVGWGGDGNVP